MGKDEDGRRRWGLRRAALVVVPTVAALGAGSVIAMAAIPGSDGTISGCYRTGSGTLRVVDSTSQCSSLLDTPITWNQQGAKGEPGPAGPAGPAGSSGGGGPATPPAADGTAELSIPGITSGGEGDADGRIRVVGFSLGVSSTNRSGTTRSGRASFDSFHIAKIYDQSSLGLFNAVASGKRLPEVDVSFVKDGAGGPQRFLRYRFQDVVVDGYKQGAGNAAELLEDVSFNYARVTISYTTANGAEATTSWDVAQNSGG